LRIFHVIILADKQTDKRTRMKTVPPVPLTWETSILR